MMKSWALARLRGVNAFRCSLASGPSIADVFGDGAVKQRLSCVTIRDMAAKALLGDPRNVLAVDQNLAEFQIVEAQQQADEGALARTAAPDQANLSAPAEWSG